jgi:hypothetical protein
MTGATKSRTYFEVEVTHDKYLDQTYMESAFESEEKDWEDYLLSCCKGVKGNDVKVRYPPTLQPSYLGR